MAPTHILAVALIGPSSGLMQPAIAPRIPFLSIPRLSQRDLPEGTNDVRFAPERMPHATTLRLRLARSFRADALRSVASASTSVVAAPARQYAINAAARFAVVPPGVTPLGRRGHPVGRMLPGTRADATARRRPIGDEHPHIRGPPAECSTGARGGKRQRPRTIARKETER